MVTFNESVMVHVVVTIFVPDDQFVDAISVIEALLPAVPVTVAPFPTVLHEYE